MKGLFLTFLVWMVGYNAPATAGILKIETQTEVLQKTGMHVSMP